MTVCQTAMRTRRLGLEGCLAQEDAPVELARYEPDCQLSPLDSSSCPVLCQVCAITTFSNTSSCKARLVKDCQELIKMKASMGMMLDKTMDTQTARETRAKQITLCELRESFVLDIYLFICI